jgi:hypothetical protein
MSAPDSNSSSGHRVISGGSDIDETQAVFGSFVNSFMSGQAQVTKATKKKSAYTVTPDPDNPGMMKKCFNVPDLTGTARQPGQFGELRGDTPDEGVKAQQLGGQYRSNKLCNKPRDYYTTAELLEVYPRGVMNEGLVPDESTGRIDPSAIAGHVNNLQSMDIVKAPPTGKVGGTTQVDMDLYIKQDNELYASLQYEYCHYNERYMYSLRQFLTLATSRDEKDNPAAQDMLELSRKLNLRVNSVLEVMNYLAQGRVGRVNSNKSAIDKSNNAIRNRLKQMGTMYKSLSKDNAIVTTQREMVRYTEEKNAYTANQIAVWTALNVVTLGAILFVYRN